MIRHSSYACANNREKPVELDPLEVQYRELLQLRERVREAEAALAKRAKPRKVRARDIKAEDAS
jgi:hypothetical protein